MRPELLLILLMTVFPGAAAVRVWDFIGRVEGRSKTSLLGLGAFFGLTLYTVCQVLGVFDLRSLVDRQGATRIDLLLAPGSMMAFLGVTACAVIGAYGAARLAFSALGARFFGWAFGRTVSGSNWAEVVYPAAEKWVHVTTSTGRTWRGAFSVLPDSGEGYVSLAKPALSVGDDWWEGNELVILPVSEIECIQVHPGEEEPDGGQDQ